MNFSKALKKLKKGYFLQRQGWNGKGMYIFLIENWDFHDWTLSSYLTKSELASCDLAPFIAMKTASDSIVSWLASQADLLADDWDIATEDPAIEDEEEPYAITVTGSPKDADYFKQFMPSLNADSLDK